MAGAGFVLAALLILVGVALGFGYVRFRQGRNAYLTALYFTTQNPRPVRNVGFALLPMSGVCLVLATLTAASGSADVAVVSASSVVVVNILLLSILLLPPPDWTKPRWIIDREDGTSDVAGG